MVEYDYYLCIFSLAPNFGSVAWVSNLPSDKLVLLEPTDARETGWSNCLLMQPEGRLGTLLPFLGRCGGGFDQSKTSCPSAWHIEAADPLVRNNSHLSPHPRARLLRLRECSVNLSNLGVFVLISPQNPSGPSEKYIPYRAWLLRRFS